MSFAIWSQRLLTQVRNIQDCSRIYSRRLSFTISGKATVIGIRLSICLLSFRFCFGRNLLNFQTKKEIFRCICLALLTVSVWKDFYVAIYGLSIIAGGFVVYFLFVFPNTLPRFVHQVEGQCLFSWSIDFEVFRKTDGHNPVHIYCYANFRTPRFGRYILSTKRIQNEALIFELLLKLVKYIFLINVLENDYFHRVLKKITHLWFLEKNLLRLIFWKDVPPLTRISSPVP